MKYLTYTLIMTLVTYLVRMLPITLLRRDITNKYIKSFLYYVPYAALSALTFPAIFSATNNTISSLAGTIIALILAYKDKSLLTVAFSACLVAYIFELFI